MTTSERVEKLLNGNIELQGIHDSLDNSLARLEFTEFLEKVIGNNDELGLNAPSEPDEAPSGAACEAVRSFAKQYVDQPLWHNRWLTHYLLVGVVESQLNLLLWASKWGAFPWWSSRHSLPAPFRRFVPPLISLAIFLLSVGLLVWLVSKDHFVLAMMLGAWMCYFYLLEKPYVWWNRWRTKKRFAHQAQLLVRPLYEIKSSNYDAVTISRRLQSCEEKDLQVASIAFALLKLHPDTARMPSESRTA